MQVACHVASKIIDINYSTCGDYAVLQVLGSDRRIILPIPWPCAIVPPGPQSLDLRTSVAGKIQHPVYEITQRSQSGIANIGPASHVFQDGRVTTFSVSTEKHDTWLSTKEGSKSNSVKLVSLPYWPGIERSRQQIFTPSHFDESLRISIDRSPSTSYDLARYGERNEVIPAFIHRNMGFIGHNQVTSHLLGSSEQVSGYGKISDTPDKKRLRSTIEDGLSLQKGKKVCSNINDT